MLVNFAAILMSQRSTQTRSVSAGFQSIITCARAVDAGHAPGDAAGPEARRGSAGPSRYPPPWTTPSWTLPRGDWDPLGDPPPALPCPPAGAPGQSCTSGTANGETRVAEVSAAAPAARLGVSLGSSLGFAGGDHTGAGGSAACAAAGLPSGATQGELRMSVVACALHTQKNYGTGLQGCCAATAMH